MFNKLKFMLKYTLRKNEEDKKKFKILNGLDFG